jgi:hypothetical protein
MGRQHLPSKKNLGKPIDQRTLDVSRQLSRILATSTANARQAAPAVVAAAAAGQAYWPAPETADAEASIIEDLAVYQGADVLFASGKEGPITALAIILIPEENRQNRRIAALAANFGFVAHLSRKRKIAVAVPEGYVTDFASIPGLVQWLIQPFGRHSEAAVIHDWLYTLGTPGDGKGRHLADRTFRRALHLVGVGFLRRWIMYLAVRMGGKSGYGLSSDYDFRDLVELKRRDPLPDKTSFAYTWKEMDIPKAPKPGKPKRSEPAPASMTQAEAKQEMKDASVAVEKR